MTDSKWGVQRPTGYPDADMARLRLLLLGLWLEVLCELPASFPPWADCMVLPDQAWRELREEQRESCNCSSSWTFWKRSPLSLETKLVTSEWKKGDPIPPTT